MFLDTLQVGLTGLASSGGLNTTFSVVLAAIVHSGVVRKEIKSQVQKVTDSIDGVADALKKELTTQGGRISNIEQGVVKLSERVGVLEQKEIK